MGITLADEKNDEKKVVSAVASAGTAYPGKEGFGRIPERADLARLRSSFGWAGGLFALRVTRRGHCRLGAWRLGAWRLGRGLEYLVGVVLGGQIS